MRSTTRGWLLGACVLATTTGACAFLSDFPDVETDERLTSASGTGGTGATSTGDSSAESGASSAASTASGVCEVTFCEGAACATPVADTTTGFRTNVADGYGISMGLAAMDGEVYFALAHKDAIEVVPGSLSIGGGGNLTGDFLYQVSGTREFVARAYECHLPNGTLYSTPVAATQDRFVFAMTSAAPSAGTESELTLDRAPNTTNNCASGQSGLAFAGGDLVPFLTTFPRQAGNQVIMPATEDVGQPGDGVHAAYQAVGARGQQVAVLGVVPSGFRLFAQIPNCSGSTSCRFVANFDFNTLPGDPEWVEIIPAIGPAVGEFPDIDDPDADITIDEAGTVWALGNTPNSELFIYKRASADLQGTMTTSGNTMAIKARSIVTDGGVVYVVGSVIGDLTIGSMTRVGHGPSRDLFVAAFDATTFGPGATPLWIAPKPGDEGFDVTHEDDGYDIVVHRADGCAPSIYVTGCIGVNATGGCEDDLSDGEPSRALILRLDLDGNRLRATEIPPSAGRMSARHLLLDPQLPRLWSSFIFEGTALTFNSTPPYPAHVVAAFPL